LTDFPCVGKPVAVAVSLAFVGDAVAIDIMRKTGSDVAGVWDRVGVAIECGAGSQFAGIGDGVGVAVGCAGGEFAGVAYAVVVAIGLRWIEDGGAVVVGVGATIAISVDGWWDCDCDGVEPARRDA
jgi:hypothetical protein